MANYQGAFRGTTHLMNSLTLTTALLQKSTSAEKIKTGTILRLNKKNAEDKELPRELATKIGNDFADTLPTDIKLSKAQINKPVQSEGSFCFWLGNSRKKELTNIAIPLVTDNLLSLVKCNK